jgi:hypothetical protein
LGSAKRPCSPLKGLEWRMGQKLSTGSPVDRPRVPVVVLRSTGDLGGRGTRRRQDINLHY